MYPKVGLCKTGFIASPGNTAKNNCNTLIINAQQIHIPVHMTFCTLLCSVMDRKTVQIMKENTEEENNGSVVVV